MVAPEYHRAYRRGIVLGLSLAELFILLVFLLLLALIGYTLARDDEDARREQEPSDGLTKISEADLNDLIKGKAAAEGRAADAEAKQKIAEGRAADAEAKQRAADDRARESDQRADESGQRAEQQAQTIDTQQQEIDRLRQAVGQESPCWYTIVQKQDGEREKAVYIFDVRISDETVLVQKHSSPLRPDAYTPSVEYNRAALGRELSYTEFMHAFEPMKIAGRNERIRDRRCYFHVLMWNNTTNITAYDTALHDFVNQVFVPTRVRDDPWPD